VSRGLSQKEGIDYDEILAPIASLLPSGSLSLLPQFFFFGWKLHQIDVKTDFLNDEIEQEVILNNLRGS
jgi:hypothetical protein